MIDADQFTPISKGLIPTGELKKVDGTPFDFRKPTPIGDRLDAKDPQIAFGPGYDHNFVLRRTGSSLELAAKVTEPTTGRVMEVLTTEPGLQFYTGNFLDGTLKGVDGKSVSTARGLLHGDAAFPGFAEPSRASLRRCSRGATGIIPKRCIAFRPTRSD